MPDCSAGELRKGRTMMIAPSTVFTVAPIPSNDPPISSLAMRYRSASMNTVCSSSSASMIPLIAASRASIDSNLVGSTKSSSKISMISSRIANRDSRPTTGAADWSPSDDSTAAGTATGEKASRDERSVPP